MVSDRSRTVGRARSHAVFVFDGNDVLIFESADVAVRFLEPIDVCKGIYVLFLADGSPGRLFVLPSKDPQRGMIELQFAAGDSASRSDFRKRLESCLIALGVPRTTHDGKMALMISELQSRLGFTR